MERISVRELRQHASRWLQRVHLGESFEVTDRGRPVAVLVPRPEGDGLQRLIDAGLVRPHRVDFRELPQPLPARTGEELPSVMLERLRADER
ncbi:MAG: hypothetical protein QOF51_658 [Chloroflexota bacterium]|jgi:prevent-host-death family protein|nr:hypothetical protein [Chloroflexota bacterium]